MIRINFDPEELERTDSTLFRASDFKDPVSMAVKLRVPRDLLSQYLRGKLSDATKDQLEKYDGSGPPPELLQDALVNDLNQVLNSPDLFDKKRFAGVTWTKEREALMPALMKLKPQGEGLVCLNRLLMEEAYPNEIAKSRKAGWDA